VTRNFKQNGKIKKKTQIENPKWKTIEGMGYWESVKVNAER